MMWLMEITRFALSKEDKERSCGTKMLNDIDTVYLIYYSPVEKIRWIDPDVLDILIEYLEIMW